MKWHIIKKKHKCKGDVNLRTVLTYSEHPDDEQQQNIYQLIKDGHG